MENLQVSRMASLIAMAVTFGAALTGVNLGNLFSSVGDTVSDPSTNAGKGFGAGGNGKGNGSGNGNSGGNGNGGPGSGVGGGNGKGG